MDKEIVLVGNRSNLPEKIEDLSKFILIGREKLSAVRAEIRAIDKLGLAHQVRNQKLEEAKILSLILLDAETKIGELLLKLPTGNGCRRRSHGVSVLFSSDEKTKGEVIKELGFTTKQAHHFETLAKHKELVQEFIEKSENNNEIISRKSVINYIKEHKKQNATKKQPRKKKNACAVSENIINLLDENDIQNEPVEMNPETYQRLCDILWAIQETDLRFMLLDSCAEQFRNRLMQEEKNFYIHELLSKLRIIQNLLMGFLRENENT